jgi:outer membrane protein assembly factor BamB
MRTRFLVVLVGNGLLLLGCDADDGRGVTGADREMQVSAEAGDEPTEDVSTEDDVFTDGVSTGDDGVNDDGVSTEDDEVTDDPSTDDDEVTDDDVSTDGVSTDDDGVNDDVSTDDDGVNDGVSTDAGVSIEDEEGISTDTPDDATGDEDDMFPDDPSSDDEVSPCAAGTSDHDADGTTECEPCLPGEYCTGSDAAAVECPLGSFDSDLDPATECASVTLCAADEYEFAAPSRLSDRECAIVSDCAPGYRLSVQGTAASDRQCEACPDGTFSTELNSSMCVAWTVCAADEYEANAPSERADRQCATLGDCAAGYQVATQPTATSDRECEMCPSGTFSSQQNEQACSPWALCNSTEYVSRMPSSTWDRQCVDDGTCSAGWWVVSGPTSSRPRECEPCADGTFSTEVNSGVCVAWVTCTVDEYESESPSANADRECATLTMCSAGYQVVTEPTATSDRACEACADGTFSSEENSAECTTWAAPCPSEEYESQAPTATSDRECSEPLSAWQFGTPSLEHVRALHVDASSNLLLAGETRGDLYGSLTGGSDVFTSKFDSNGQLVWANQFGSATSDEDSVTALSGDSSGNMIVAGDFQVQAVYECTDIFDCVITSPESSEAFVAKLDVDDGTEVWTLRFGPATTENVVVALGVDGNDHVLVAGTTNGDLYGTNPGSYDAFVNKLGAADGTVMWSEQFGTSGVERVTAAAVDIAGNIVVAGYTSGSLFAPTAGGGYDAFVVKLDSGDGSAVWSRQLGTNTHDQADALDVDGAGNVIVAGYTNGSLYGASAGNSDVYVAKLAAADGEVAWAKQFGTAGFERVTSVKADASGNAVVTGHTPGSLYATTAGGNDVYVVKFAAADGAVVWSYQAGSSSTDSSTQSVSISPSGDVVVLGNTSGGMYGSSAGSQDTFLVRLDADLGTVVWSMQVGSLDYDDATSLSTNADGNLVVAGYSGGDLFGVSAGSYDAFVAKFSFADGALTP